MCVPCEKSQHQIHFACVQRHLRSYMHRSTDVTKLRCVRSRNVFCCTCSHCGFIARHLEYNLQTRFASVLHQSLGTAPRVSFITRGGFRGRRVPGGAFGGVSTGMSLASRRAWATRAVASKDISSPVKARSKPDVSPLGTGVVSCPTSTRTARLTIGTALQLGKTFLAFL